MLTLTGIVSDRRDVRSDEGLSGVEGHCVTEVGIRRAVASGELLRLVPVVIGIGKDVGRALTGMTIDSRIVRADKRSTVADGNGLTEAVVRRPVARGEFLRLGPSAIRLSEGIDCALDLVGPTVACGEPTRMVELDATDRPKLS